MLPSSSLLLLMLLPQHQSIDGNLANFSCRLVCALSELTGAPCRRGRGSLHVE